jgi:hypothetical protein
MKLRLIVALVGLAISFAPLAFSQQKDTVDPQVAEPLSALGKKTDEAFNSGDATALAALCTEDAVLVNATGPIYGREAIEKRWADVFKQFPFSNHLDKRDQNSPHIIGRAMKHGAMGNGVRLLKARNSVLWTPKAMLTIKSIRSNTELLQLGA